MADSESRRLRAGIVGGGRGAFIGAVHRIAAELDGEAEVIVGALSSDPEIARSSATDWHLKRSYGDFREMARAEAARSDGIEFVIVATPNHLHTSVACAFIESGIHVICDKPLAATWDEAAHFATVLERSKQLFALTHNYTGYPLVRKARSLVQEGVLGELRKVLVEYQQDWLMEPLEQGGHKQALWRTDPSRSGPGGCIGDIGTHALNLVEFVAGREVVSICAELSTFVAGRQLDDDANMLLRLDGGAKGTLVCSQVACGEENALTLRLYGSKGGLEWRQQEPNSLIVKPQGAPWQTLRTAQRYLGREAAESRIPPGHPEGYLEAFASIYRSFIADVRRVGRGEAPRRDYPGLEAGLRGMRFIKRALESARHNGAWVKL